jgi:hypothetical protein
MLHPATMKSPTTTRKFRATTLMINFLPLFGKTSSFLWEGLSQMGL